MPFFTGGSVLTNPLFLAAYIAPVLSQKIFLRLMSVINCSFFVIENSFLHN